ncbi:MarR family transcriptional regulator [Heyndrickxia sporothermodurans]|uniref:helix-turn-helix domain-containing protein n=1 Tax=Bacilli TaxID=91061 RepID=UPI0012E1C8F6|nr:MULTISPECIES: helix-turn-helix domain-containing protein [Bacilli]MEB6551432.1 MarR family transcriptional regulator [Heyndrickxia sporothermodurans]QGU39458.1 helix-turn-helix domain-containing protein [Streptococcus mutans]HAJ4014869.1 helix-turn-helix domain-containing protein [Escherichia coli]HAJ4024464.1 helix-turn-helix domain-containing protein [Escherichia coli]
MTKKNNKIGFGQAERNARKRDFENQKEKFKQDHRGVDQKEADDALKTLSKATGKEILVITKRSPQSKVRFVQLIQDNWNYALETGFFTDEEMLFLMRIQRFLQFKSNCIVDDIHSRSAVPMTQKALAEKLGTSAPKVSRLVNGLVEKGVIVKAQGQKIEGNNVRTYALFINPNIIYSGERDNVETTLKALFTNAKPLFKDFPVALF